MKFKKRTKQLNVFHLIFERCLGGMPALKTATTRTNGRMTTLLAEGWHCLIPRIWICLHFAKVILIQTAVRMSTQ